MLENRRDQLFEKYTNMVFRICYRYTNSREDADDMAQNVFIKAYEGLKSFQGKSGLMTWIYRIAINTCMDELRKRQRRNQLLMENIDELVISNIQSEDEQCLARLTLNKILKEINPTTKEALFLVYAEGLSHAEVAHLLGVSREAVTQRLAKFRMQIEHSQKTSQ